MPSPARQLPVDFNARARSREDRGGGGSEREREPRDLTLSSPPLTTTPRRLRPAERFLAAFLRDAFQTAGAATMVRRFGFANVVAAVRDMNGTRVLLEPAFTGRDGHRWRARYAWRFPGLHSPGGFLRSTLLDRESSQ